MPYAPIDPGRPPHAAVITREEGGTATRRAPPRAALEFVEARQADIRGTAATASAAAAPAAPTPTTEAVETVGAACGAC